MNDARHERKSDNDISWLFGFCWVSLVLDSFVSSFFFLVVRFVSANARGIRVFQAFEMSMLGLCRVRLLGVRYALGKHQGHGRRDSAREYFISTENYSFEELPCLCVILAVSSRKRHLDVSRISPSC